MLFRKKKNPATHLTTCTTFPYNKHYEVVESKKKKGYGICPACGEFHALSIDKSSEK